MSTETGGDSSSTFTNPYSCEGCTYHFENVNIEQGFIEVLGPPPTREQVECIQVEDCNILNYDVAERVVAEGEQNLSMKEYIVSFMVSSKLDDDELDLEGEDQYLSRSRSSSSGSKSSMISNDSMNSFAKAMYACEPLHFKS